MLPFSIFKKRKQQAEQAGKPVVYKYDPLPRELRIQIIHIFAEIIDPHWRDGSPLWEYIRTAMAKEIGAFNLAGEHEPFQDCQLYTQTERDTDLVLSLIEVVLYSAISHEGQYVNHDALDSAITELNQRFREHQVGYQYQVGGSQAGQIVRMDSEELPPLRGCRTGCLAARRARIRRGLRGVPEGVQALPRGEPPGGDGPGVERLREHDESDLWQATCALRAECHREYPDQRADQGRSHSPST